MLPKGPFEAADFKPDVPDDITAQLSVDPSIRSGLTAEEQINKEQQEKEEYRKRRVRDEKEVVCSSSSFISNGVRIYISFCCFARKNIDKMHDSHRQIILHLTQKLSTNRLKHIIVAGVVTTHL